MDEQKWQQLQHVHFVGIGGIGMSALAQHFYKHGIEVTGSDLSTGKMVKHLEEIGIKVEIGHSEENLSLKADLVIASMAVLAIKDRNPEVSLAEERGIEVMSYPQALGELTKNYLTIAVAGSHGKTTTTGMIAKMLIDNGLDPTVVLGSTAEFLDSGGNYRMGQSPILVIEACEYYAGFLDLYPDITVVVNVEHDHFDAYPTRQSYLDAFKELVEKTASTYPVILNTDFELGKQLMDEVEHEVLTFGLEGEITLADLDTRMAVPGDHNRVNALAALAVARLLELDKESALASLATFSGTARRLEFKSERDDCRIYSDYAHHPTEIKASLKALRELYPQEQLTVVYQAHQHHRTKELLTEFAMAFSDADEVVVVPIYAARDSAALKEEVTAKDLAESIGANHDNVSAVTEKTALLALASELTKKSDVLVIMGAGDVEKLLS